MHGMVNKQKPLIKGEHHGTISEVKIIPDINRLFPFDNPRYKWMSAKWNSSHYSQIVREKWS